MARLATTGFEWNDTSNPLGVPDGNFNTGATIDSATFRSGAFSAKIDMTVSASTRVVFLNLAGSTTTTYFARAYVNFSSLGSTNAFASAVLSETSVKNGIGLVSGALQWVPQGNGTPTGATFTPSTGVWYRLEYSYQSSSGAWEWRVDGNTIATGTDVSATAPTNFCVGPALITGAHYVANFDDVALNDSTGAAQTSWSGDGKVVLLVPASDNAKGTGWTNDAAGASNFFDAVNNEPPVGIADTTAGSGLHQIRNATSNANVNYDANLTTYTAAGIDASDTVNVLVPEVATAAPVTTSSKQGTVGVSSNPAITNVALSAGGTAGAFWAGSAASTYPSGWKWSFATTTYAPTVTLGSAPVMRITQVTSSTRIAMVCAMGMYVDYTPAPLPPPGVGAADGDLPLIYLRKNV